MNLTCFTTRLFASAYCCVSHTYIIMQLLQGQTNTIHSRMSKGKNSICVFVSIFSVKLANCCIWFIRRVYTKKHTLWLCCVFSATHDKFTCLYFSFLVVFIMCTSMFVSLCWPVAGSHCHPPPVWQQLKQRENLPSAVVLFLAATEGDTKGMYY